MPEFVNPIEILNQLELRSSMIAADFGCGTGGWTIPLAQRLEQGKVFAIDILEEPLSALKAKTSLQGISNINRILADVEKGVPEIQDSSCDLVLMTDLLFQLDEREAVFNEANRVLKTGSKILVVSWNVNSSFGPRQGKVSPDEVKEIAKNSGFKLEKQFKAGDYHYGLVFTKQ